MDYKKDKSGHFLQLTPIPILVYPLGNALFLKDISEYCNLLSRTPDISATNQRDSKYISECSFTGIFVIVFGRDTLQSTFQIEKLLSLKPVNF